MITTHVAVKDVGLKPNMVTRVTKLEVYLGEFTDERGQKTSRVFLKLPDTEFVWVVQQSIAGSHVVTEPNKWLKEQFNKMLAGDTGDPESI
jgi:hypothetical protein